MSQELKLHCSQPCPVNTTVPNNGCTPQFEDDEGISTNGNSEGFQAPRLRPPRTGPSRGPAARVTAVTAAAADAVASVPSAALDSIAQARAALLWPI